MCQSLFIYFCLFVFKEVFGSTAVHLCFRSLSQLKFVNMGTLVCPLCCDEEFSNQLSLRYHLLSVTDNVYCPECSQRFDSILQLADHLDGMCGKAELESNAEEYTSESDTINTDGRSEETEMKIHERDTPETEVATKLNNPENVNSDFHEVSIITVRSSGMTSVT